MQTIVGLGLFLGVKMFGRGSLAGGCKLEESDYGALAGWMGGCLNGWMAGWGSLVGCGICFGNVRLRAVSFAERYG
jgi:hypothetical protein